MPGEGRESPEDFRRRMARMDALVRTLRERQLARRARWRGDSPDARERTQLPARGAP